MGTLDERIPNTLKNISVGTKRIENNSTNKLVLDTNISNVNLLNTLNKENNTDILDLSSLASQTNENQTQDNLLQSSKNSGNILDNNNLKLDLPLLNTENVSGIDISSLTEEEKSKILNNMSSEQYDEFIKGVENYHQKQADYYENVLNGEDGLNQMYDDLVNEYVEITQTYTLNSAKNNYDQIMTERRAYYIDYAETLDLFDGTNMTLDKFMNLDPEECVKFLIKHDSEAQNAYDSYNQYKEFINDKISEDLKKYNIKDLESLETAKEELNQQIFDIEEKQKLAKNNKDSAKYDYLGYLQEFNTFTEKKPTQEELNDIVYSIDYTEFSYTDYHIKHPNISPTQYVKMLYEKYGDTYNIKITGIDNIKDIRAIVEVSDDIPNFKKVYEYLYNESPEKADEYIKDIKYEINNIRGQLEANKFLSTLGEKDGSKDKLEAVANELGITKEGLIDGISSFGSGVYYTGEALLTGLGLIEENRVTSASEYKKMYILQALTSEAQKEKAGLITKNENNEYTNTDSVCLIDYTKNYSGIFLSNNYEISQGIGNMLPSVLLSAACPMAGSVAMGVSAGGNSYHQAMVEGYDYANSLLYGIASGSTEAITEKFLGGLPGLSDVEVNSVKTWLKAIAKEGNEEVYQNFIDIAFRATLLGEKIEIPTTKEEFTSFLEEQGKTWGYGAITAGIMQSPQLLTAAYNYTKTRPIDVEKISSEKLAKYLESGKVSLEELNVNQLLNIINDESSNYTINDLSETQIRNLLDAKFIKLEELTASQALEQINSSEGKYEVSDLSDSQVRSLLDSGDIKLEELTAYQALEQITNPEGKYEISDLTNEQSIELIDNNKLEIDQILEYINNSHSINEKVIAKYFDSFIGKNLSEEWVKAGDTDKIKTDMYVRLLEFSNQAGITMEQLNKSINILKNDSIKKYYQDATKLELQYGGKIFETYRSHGVVHIIDVLTETIDSLQSLKKLGININDEQMDTAMLAAIMHDTGMSGGKQLRLSDNELQGLSEIQITDAQKVGDVVRESHSFNSACITLENYQLLLEQGYSRTQIAEAALLAFAHSKSNSGLNPLTSEVGWSFAIQALETYCKKYLKDPETGIVNYDIEEELINAGLITSKSLSTNVEEVEIKTPKVYKNEDGESNKVYLSKDGKTIKIGGGKKKAKIKKYYFNAEQLNNLSYSALVIRMGDALTNNDHALVNQYLKEINLSGVDYTKQVDINIGCNNFKNMYNQYHTDTYILEQEIKKIKSKYDSDDDISTSDKKLIDKLEKERQFKKQFYDIASDPKNGCCNPFQVLKMDWDDGIQDAAFLEAGNITYEVDGKINGGSQPFVLGEANQTYAINTIEETQTMQIVVSVKESENIPLCTIFAIEERAQELISRGSKGIFTDVGDGKKIELVIKLKESTPKNIIDIYKKYSEYYSGNDLLEVKIEFID